VALRSSQHRSVESTESASAPSGQREGLWLSLLLGFALIRGLLQVAIVPPWQHYDEPSHFEYAWLIANRQELLQAGDYDLTMRREVAASMQEYNFYRGHDYRPDLLSDTPVNIGFTQVGDPPFYYLLAALPLRLVRHADIAFQLYAARLVSLALYVLSIWIASRLVGELVKAGHPLRWTVPGMLAFLPAYTDLMTAANNDVGAAFLFSLFLWGSVRTVIRGVSPVRLVWVLGTAALCVWTKNTAALAVVLAPLVVALSLFRRPWKRRTWVGLIGTGLLLLGAVFSWGDAALWYRGKGAVQEGPTRQQVAEAPLGQHVLAVETISKEPGRQLIHPLLREDVEALRGKTVTVGAWMWASQPVQVRSPMVHYDRGLRSWQTVEVGTAPTFHAITATIAVDAELVEVILHPLLDKEQDKAITIYYDGVVLVEGEWPLDQAPIFTAPGGQEGTWGGRRFVNRPRNGSGESAWPRVRPWVEEKLGRFMPWPHSPTLLVASVLDWQRTGWIYGRSAVNLLKSFWGHFAWGHVNLSEAWYWVLSAGTTLGAVGALVGLTRLWRSDQPAVVKRAVGLLAGAGLLVWLNTISRSHPVQLSQGNMVFLPAARYAYPVIIPTLLALMGGWLALMPHRAKVQAATGLLVGLSLLDTVSLATIVSFYAGR